MAAEPGGPERSVDEVDGASATPPPAVSDTDPGPASTEPGSQAAIAAGCTCSVLANAAFRSGAPGEAAFVDPSCPLHHAAAVLNPTSPPPSTPPSNVTTGA